MVNKIIAKGKKVFTNPQSSILSAAMIIMLMIVASRILGLFRQRALAHFFTVDELIYKFICKIKKMDKNRFDNAIIIITSDHGEAYGEKILKFIPIYGHPTGIHISALVEVPWFVVKSKKLQNLFIKKDFLEKFRIKHKIKELKDKL